MNNPIRVMLIFNVILIECHLFCVYFQIVALVEEISRLRSALAALQESHNIRIQQLEDRLEAKRQHISRLESRLDKQSDYDDAKKENRQEHHLSLSSASYFFYFSCVFLFQRNQETLNNVEFTWIVNILHQKSTFVVCSFKVLHQM